VRSQNYSIIWGATMIHTEGKKRQDTKLESEGAEFLVVGMLLVEGIQCFKAYTNFQGYDLVAINQTTKKTARIQVKSRWATDYDQSFPIKNFDCEFVVLAALNRGYRFHKSPVDSEGGDGGRKPPQFYCFPVEVVRAAQNPNSKWGKVPIRKIPKYESYLNRWSLVRESIA
jgi:hypothetical protein